jgi:hypothetical protein
MRTLFVGALAVTLVGCSCFVSPQAGVEACTGAGGRIARRKFRDAKNKIQDRREDGKAVVGSHPR